MAFRWRCLDASGATVGASETDFVDQATAEDWLSECWPALRDDGVAAVTLLDGDVAVYGPMSLADP